MKYIYRNIFPFKMAAKSPTSSIDNLTLTVPLLVFRDGVVLTVGVAGVNLRTRVDEIKQFVKQTYSISHDFDIFRGHDLHNYERLEPSDAIFSYMDPIPWLYIADLDNKLLASMVGQTNGNNNASGSQSNSQPNNQPVNRLDSILTQAKPASKLESARKLFQNFVMDDREHGAAEKVLRALRLQINIIVSDEAINKTSRYLERRIEDISLITPALLFLEGPDNIGLFEVNRYAKVNVYKYATLSLVSRGLNYINQKLLTTEHNAPNGRYFRLIDIINAIIDHSRQIRPDTLMENPENDPEVDYLQVDNVRTALNGVTRSAVSYDIYLHWGFNIKLADVYA